MSDTPVPVALSGTTRGTSRNSELFHFLTLHVVRSDKDAERLRGGVDTGEPVLSDGTGSSLVVPPHAPPTSQAPTGTCP